MPSQASCDLFYHNWGVPQLCQASENLNLSSLKLDKIASEVHYILESFIEASFNI
ncbi:unnamed protein product [marine sediment metagenome]|uniref:Uncharacterized protein n=1 Tax=marine sediment metagenome TaxID=412755 RepID=X1IUT1_9ZZZZ